MASTAQKTVRFSRVVEKAGQPEVHTLWLPPGKDPTLQRAEKLNQVMTVAPKASGTKTDVGVVGFDPQAGKRSQFLIFPKSLKRFQGARVIGIRFDLVAQPKFTAATTFAAAGRSKPAARKHKPAPLPAAPTAPEPESPATEEVVVPFETDAREPVRHARAAKPEPAPRAKAASRRAEPATGSNKPPRTAKPRQSARAAETHPATARLLREVRAAMKELQRGQSVAAYQRLERAVSTDHPHRRAGA